MIAGQPAGSNGTNVPGTKTGKGKNVQTAPPVAAKTPAS
jgi:hypothetical protein